VRIEHKKWSRLKSAMSPVFMLPTYAVFPPSMFLYTVTYA